MARVLIVTSEFEPFISSGINRLSFFKRFLEQQGHFVAVLTTNASAQSVCSDKAYDDKNHIHRAFTLSQLARRLLSSRRLPIYPKLSRTGKYDVWLPFAINKGKRLINTLNIDVVFTSFPDFSSLLVAEQITRKTATKLLVDFRDPPYWIYDEVTLNKKIEYRQNIVKKAIELASQIITCTQHSKSSLISHYNIENKVVVIGNGYDAEIINSLPSQSIRNDEFFEIVHIGSFYDEGRDIKPVVSALEKYAAKTKKKIKFRLVGDIPDNQTITTIKAIAKSVVISIEPPVKMRIALAIAKQADVLLLLQGTRFDQQIPAKLYEYLALNRLIWAVVGSKGETHKLLKNYSENVVFNNYDNTEDINDGPAMLLKHKSETIDVSALSRQAQTQKLAELISLIHSNGNN